MQINNSIMKSRGAGGQVQIPHTDKPLVEHFPDLIQMLPVIFLPAQQCLIVVKPQVFHIQNMEPLVSHSGNHLSQAGNNTARENVSLNPRVSRMFRHAADKVQQKQSAGLQRLGGILDKERVILPSHMFRHFSTKIQGRKRRYKSPICRAIFADKSIWHSFCFSFSMPIFPDQSIYIFTCFPQKRQPGSFLLPDRLVTVRD